jgi:uncharacterized membrane protein YdjX (TVP38/TMEM64 family)
VNVFGFDHDSLAKGKKIKTPQQKEEERKNILKALILAGFLVATFALIHLSPVGDYLQISQLDQLQRKLAEFQSWAPFVFLMGGAVLIAVGTPRSLISISGGILFGLYWGMFLALGAALLGSTVVFLLTKMLGRSLFKQKVGPYLKIIENHSKTNGFLMVVLMRQLPLTCILINVLIGLTSISTGIFLLGSIVGLLPETIIFTLFGSSLQESFVLRVSLAAFLLILLILVLKIYLQRSELAQDLSQKLKSNRDKSELTELKG